MQIIIAGESQLLWSSQHPEGSSRWNEMHYRILCIFLGSVLHFLYADPPSLSVNSAVNGTLLRLRALPGSDELLLHKAGRLRLLEKRMNYILLFVFSLYSRRKPSGFCTSLPSLLFVLEQQQPERMNTTCRRVEVGATSLCIFYQ